MQLSFYDIMHSGGAFDLLSQKLLIVSDESRCDFEAAFVLLLWGWEDLVEPLNCFFDKLIVFHERVGIFLNVATCLEYCAEMRVRTPKLRKLFYF